MLKNTLILVVMLVVVVIVPSRGLVLLNQN